MDSHPSSCLVRMMVPVRTSRGGGGATSVLLRFVVAATRVCHFVFRSLPWSDSSWCVSMVSDVVVGWDLWLVVLVHVGGRRDPSQPRWTSSSVPVRLSSLTMERTTTNPSDFDRISTRTILRGHALSPLVQWDGFCPSKGGISHVSQRTFLGSTPPPPPPPLGFPFPRSKGDVFPFPSGLSFDPRRGRTGPYDPTSGKRMDHEIDPTPTFTPTTVVVVVVVGWTSG